MAKVKFNPLLELLQGKVGAFEFKRFKDGIVVAKARTINPRQPTAAQASQRDRFKEAIRYARSVLADPQQRAAYEAPAKDRGITVFALSIADFLNAPVVERIDCSGYHGNAGEILRIFARDNFKVTGVEVILTAPGGSELERGSARRDPASNGWIYIAKTTIPPGRPVTIEATATDRPGHRTSLMTQKALEDGYRGQSIPTSSTSRATTPLPPRMPLSDEDILARARAFLGQVRTRRSVRDFSDRPVPRSVIEAALAAAGSAPSGANLQPWHFVAVNDSEVKRRLREAAEAEEREFYAKRAPAHWREALAPIGTDASKPFLERAPWLIAIFSLRQLRLPDHRVTPTYYPLESVGIATGLLITALHLAGLVTLTHTPSPMRFLNEILGRPPEEKPFLLLVVGHPADGARVPDLPRKTLADIATFVGHE